MDKWSKKINDTRERLDEVSPSMCLAKWFQVTMHLQNGFTHSCHHPAAHKIPLVELEQNPSALHNTVFKKEQRKLMLEGKRPEECSYCWNIEDSSEKAVSDRLIKSSDKWARESWEVIQHNTWEANVNPTYLEVSFGSQCNLRCAYCNPDISSSIWSEFEKFGPYPTAEPINSLEGLEELGRRPFGKDEPNPYVDAFWNWWPTLRDSLKVFRITGGEPLVNQNTFRVLNEIKSHPMPELELAINTNLCVPGNRFDKMMSEVKDLLETGKIKSFKLFTSVDTHGKQAEFIRYGLNYSELMANADRFLDQFCGLDATVVYMVTFNLLSVPGYKKFLQDFEKLRQKHYNPALNKSVDDLSCYVDPSYLRFPEFLCLNLLDDEMMSMLFESLDYMTENPFSLKTGYGFTKYEVTKLSRVFDWLKTARRDPEINRWRGDFYKFIEEYEKRKNLNFLKTFPELSRFHHKCKAISRTDYFKKEVD